MQDITVRLPGILDPRAHASIDPIPLAPRQATLAGAKLLLFDNGKLHRRYGHNAVIFQTVAPHLQSEYGVQECRRLSRDLLSMPLSSLRDLAGDIAGLGVDAVLLALCDSGVTAYTIVLAWELEQRGLPTVTLCSGQTIHLAASMSLPVMPGLPLSQLHIQRHSSAADIATETLRALSDVAAGFTTAAALLRRSFDDTYTPGGARLQADAAGELHPWASRRVPLSGPDVSTIVHDPAEDAAALYDMLCDHAMCDGLPVIPPTRARVEAMLTFSERSSEDVLIPQCFPSGLPLTVHTLAINAVMAGCRPEYFPILQTAAEAIAEPQYRLMQGTITSHPSGNAIIVSGPLAQEIGLASAGGCLGPGFRANITIGRALNLSLLNVAQATPGKADLSTMGSPAELTMCCAENVQASPWSPLHADLFNADTTSVTVFKCECPHNVLDHLSTTAEGLLRGIADVAATIGGNNAYVPAELLVLLNPEHAHVLYTAGWSKVDVQRYLFEQARNPRHLLEGRGVSPVRPQGFDDLEAVPVVPRPDDVLLIVAGTNGPHSMVGLPWGYSRAVTKPVLLRSGEPARCIRDFQSH
jgi:hypothetical protein